MPNWVATIVKFTGSKQDIQSVLQQISSDDLEFDFNKLIPMPESLNVESSSTSDLAYAYYYVKTFNCLPPYTHYKHNTEVIARVGSDKHHSPEEILELGKRLYDNFKNYGATTWYDWCCRNWGTKWNACEVSKGEDTLYFDTAWSFAEPIMEKLAEVCSEYQVGFNGEWADEDMGSNTGYFEASSDGSFCCDYYEDCSSDAYAAYARCHGDSDCIGIDDNGDYYKYECTSCPSFNECQG